MTMQGSELRELRKGADLTLAEMGEAVGLSGTFIGMMERGDKPIALRTELVATHLYDQAAWPLGRKTEREGDIPLRNAMLIWDRDDDSLYPPVKVVSQPDRDDPRYSSSALACDAGWELGSDLWRLVRLFAKVQELTVLEKFDPGVVHEALMVIPEYRAALAPDPGFGLDLRDDE